MRKHGLRGLLAFDRKPGEFELLETEPGEPAFWGSWHEANAAVPHSGREEDVPGVHPQVQVNYDRLKEDFRGEINPDMILRKFLFAGEIPALAAFINGMAGEELINDFILRPGMRANKPDCPEDQLAQYAMDLSLIHI